ncbi:MAG: peptide-methionine (R)-S-oxide reductase MsrB [Pseudomonadota bacterium]
MTDRRDLIVGSALAASALFVGGSAALLSRPSSAGAAASGDFEVDLDSDEWARRLTDAEFAVLRREETEEPFSSPLDALYEPGMYHCAGCGNRVYSSEHKFDSGTGWPSFWRAISPQAIGTRIDHPLIFPLTEVHCARCGGHFGHIFEDGPEPSGERHCLNGIALEFRAA